MGSDMLDYDFDLPGCCAVAKDDLPVLALAKAKVRDLFERNNIYLAEWLTYLAYWFYIIEDEESVIAICRFLEDEFFSSIPIAQLWIHRALALYARLYKMQSNTLELSAIYQRINSERMSIDWVSKGGIAESEKIIKQALEISPQSELEAFSRLVLILSLVHAIEVLFSRNLPYDSLEERLSSELTTLRKLIRVI